MSPDAECVWNIVDVSKKQDCSNGLHYEDEILV